MEYNSRTSGQRLSELREAARLTQEKLAEELGTNKQNVCHWEKGTRIPVHQAVWLADRFHVTLDYLYGVNNDQNPYAKDVTEYTGLSPQSAKVLHDLPSAYGDRCVEMLNALISSDSFSATLAQLGYLSDRAKALAEKEPIPQGQQIAAQVELQNSVDAAAGFGVVVTGIDALYYEADRVLRWMRRWIADACGIRDAEYAIAEKARAEAAKEAKAVRKANKQK